jgi:hypothetical protein
MRSDGTTCAASRATTASLRLISVAAIAVTAAACCLLPSGDVGIETKPGLPFMEDEPCPAALNLDLVGARVIERQNGIGLVLRDGRELIPVWPYGYSAERTGSGLALYHRDGTLMTRTGELVDLGGYIEGDRVEICAVDPHDPSLLEGLDTPEP